jgi:membrane associated rhomboid family serine protease
MENEQKPDDDAWIEKVVEAAGSLGFNKMRVRWKLLRWQESRRKARRWREQRIAHIRYEHKTCPECGAVQDRDEAICTRCGAKLTSRQMQMLQRIGLTAPELMSMSSLLAIAMLGVYLRVWMAGGGGLASPSSQLLIDFGGRYRPLLSDEPWRMVTAIFLHAGLIHLAFNLLAIATIGPRIEELYGRLTLLFVFVVTGVLANLGCVAIGVDGAHIVGIGASGGVMGLIGVAAGDGQRRGTNGGRAQRNDMLKWAAYTFVFGFWVHADNWAHAFGLIAGAAFGYAVRPGLWLHHRMLAVRAIAKLAGAAGAIAAVALILTRTPSPPRIETSAEELVDDAAVGFQPLFASCRSYYTGDRDGAIASVSAQWHEAASADVVEQLCDSLYQVRERCRTGDLGSGVDDSARQQHRAFCDRYGAELSSLPERPAKR